MKKICKQLLFLILMFMLSRLSAQSSILGTGGETTGSGSRASYSVGQIAVQTNSDGAISISEGVQQPYEISVVGVDTPPNIKLNASVYPNPTISNLQLAISNEEFEGEVKVFDTNGKHLFSKKIEGENTEISMSGLTSGTYFVKVISGTQVLKTFKVVKIAR